MAHLTAGVFEHHDRQRFETAAISFGPDDGSDMRARLVGAFDHFLDMRGRTDADIASYLRAMETDIVVDLVGFTEGARPAIFAARPAPAQVAYLGFPGTTGTDYMDYLVADAVIVPETEHRHFSEKIVTLPGTFMPADAARAISPRPVTRTEEGLPEDGFVFCCFNAPYKIDRQIFAIWMRLVLATPKSVLWLGQINASAQRNLLREAEARGVSSQRLIFATRRENPAEHLARLRVADLFLDTLPYNAHATASDALWAGLPVLTCHGGTFAGRVAASMLAACGLPELIAASLTEYESLASQLARAPRRLALVKAKLAQRGTSGLFDTAHYTRNLERAYVAMCERSRQGQPPASFVVPDCPPLQGRVPNVIVSASESAAFDDFLNQAQRQVMAEQDQVVARANAAESKTLTEIPLSGYLEGWHLTGLMASVIGLGALAVIVWYGADVEGIRLVIRLTARVSLVLFSLAFTAAALARRFPNAWTLWQRRNRRYLGVSFAISHGFHLIAIIALVRRDPVLFASLTNPVIIISGSIVYLFIAAMTATSFDRTAAMLGPRAWRVLHTIGGYYILLTFANAFGRRAMQDSFYLPFAGLVVLVLAIRVFDRFMNPRRRLV
jgi:DMSO/TMAO reductase YedYZ heme-binding membrane subunit